MNASKSAYVAALYSLFALSADCSGDHCLQTDADSDSEGAASLPLHTSQSRQAQTKTRAGGSSGQYRHPLHPHIRPGMQQVSILDVSLKLISIKRSALRAHMYEVVRCLAFKQDLASQGR